MSIFDFANERESVRLLRLAGVQEPWTKDEKLRTVHFGNVFREDDPTSQWIQKNVLDKATSADDRVWSACVARLFGTVEALSIIDGVTDVDEMFALLEPGWKKDWRFTGRYGATRRMPRMESAKLSLLQLQGKNLGLCLLAHPRGVYEMLTDLPGVSPQCANEILSDIDPRVEYLFPHRGIMAGLEGNLSISEAESALWDIVEQSKSEWNYPHRPWTLTTAARAALLYGQYINDDYARMRSERRLRGTDWFSRG